WPQVAPTLNEVSAQLTTEDLRELNRRVAEGESTSEVASDWLAERGLVGS
ncbi:MAG: glycine betaine ABC transporter substrate-binding protein, partial [Acidimicrobiales bacterium]